MTFFQGILTYILTLFQGIFKPILTFFQGVFALILTLFQDFNTSKKGRRKIVILFLPTFSENTILKS